MDSPVPHEKLSDIEDKYSHVSLGKCSHVSQQTEEEVLPVITPRTNRKARSKPPVFRYTNNKEGHHRHTSTLLHDSRDTDHSNQPASSPQGMNNQSELRSMFLPRLGTSEQKCSSPSRSSDGEHIRFPHINTISKANAHLALNRSITDLLDPEMEILNKIKHIPKKRRRRRKQKIATCNPNGVLTLKCDNSDIHD